jgi:phospholipid/cholesterol/gamma-HCH transport system permease protein
MTSLTAFSIGLTLAMQGAYQLAKFGATSYVPDLVSLTLCGTWSLLSEWLSLAEAGRQSQPNWHDESSEEIEALQVMAINPIRFLVVPRFLAMLVMLPALTVFGNYIGFVGGWSICHFAWI